MVAPIVVTDGRAGQTRGSLVGVVALDSVIVRVERRAYHNSTTGDLL